MKSSSSRHSVRHPGLAIGILSGLLMLPAVPTDARGGSAGFSSSSNRPPLVRSGGASAGSRALPGYRRYPQRPQHFPRNHHLISPIGSAANLPHGYYRETLSQPRAHRYGHGPVIYPQPYVVYVEQQPAPAPPPEAYEPPAPTPIYIVNQIPPAPQAPVPQQHAVPHSAAPVPQAPRPPRSSKPEIVRMAIAPSDAEVYLDDDYLGLAADLMASDLQLSPGVYILEVTHPSHRPQRLVFGVNGGETVSIDIDLAADRPGRRARVR